MKEGINAEGKRLKAKGLVFKKVKSMINYLNHKTLGGSLVPRAGLSAASPRAIAQQPSRLWAFRYYPFRILSKFDIRHSTFDIQSRESLIRNWELRIRNRALGNRHWALVIRITSIILLSILFHIQTSAQVLSLDSMLSIIDKNNPMLQEYDNKVKALNEYASGAKSWMAPMVGAGTFMTPYPGQTIEHERDRGSWMFSIEQQIPNPAKLNANKNYLSSRAGIEKQGRAIQYNTLRSEAKTYYYEWLVSLKKLVVLEENTRIIDLMLKLARIRYPYNQGTLGNIYKTEGRLSEVQNMILMTQGEIENKSSRLKALLNFSDSDSIQIDTATFVDFKLESIVNDTTSLREQRSDVKQINKTIEAMQLSQQLQKYQAKPDFKIRFDHMQPIGEMPTQFTAMAMVSIPIAPWSSKMYKAEVRGMQYDIEAMKKNREAILIETRGMLSGMARQLTRMKQQLSNYETKIVTALKKNYQTLMLAYEENREQLPMVVDGWEAMNMAEMEYLEKLEEYYKMIVKYEKETEK